MFIFLIDTHINKPQISLINYKEHCWEYYIMVDTLKFCCMENKMWHFPKNFFLCFADSASQYNLSNWTT